ncbi:Insulinase (Peptidase family M16) [Nannocystis exedens]|uniref:Insulinase (Peptidase family M16) n=1 Tax=Nannocystis exedens TaxID=54 RepID=A0A1I2H1F1_9BACT|nr:pitrilysin family protein [Nannocystis exedens]PCC67063.1 peptidase M16 [Nannocystis exedens]SFF23213.1 Insulinase (Peptidase family M16) [Nannocystis exedens]
MLAAVLALLAAPVVTPGQDAHYRLDNGLEVILRHDRRAPLVAVRLRVHAGSVDDPRGRSGLAHVVEHVAHEGSTHVDRGRRETLEYVLSAHANNAETGFYSTEYYYTAPAQATEHVLWIEADRLGFVRGQHGEPTLAGVRRIVLNERRQRAEQDPLARLEIQALAALFPAGHPYHGAIIGSAEDLAAATIADVDAFLGEHVHPGNATLVLVGDLPAETPAWIERHFGGLPAQPRPAARTVPRVTRPRELRIAAEQPVGAAPAVLMAWPSPALDEDGDAAADVLAEALERGGYVRLARAEGPPEAAEFQATQRSLPHQSVFFVRVIGRVGGEPTRLVAEVDRVLSQVAAGALAEPAVRRARLRLARAHRSAQQDLQDRAALLAAEAAAGKRLGGGQDVDEWMAVTPAEVARFAREALRPEARVAVLAEGER